METKEKILEAILRSFVDSGAQIEPLRKLTAKAIMELFKKEIDIPSDEEIEMIFKVWIEDNRLQYASSLNPELMFKAGFKEGIKHLNKEQSNERSFST
jgi:hypothetical protein